MIDYQKYKYRIADYLSRHAKITTIGKEKKINCFSHADSNPSAIIYSDRLWCPVCDKTWDIYDCVEFVENEHDRAKQYTIIDHEFGFGMPEPKQESKMKTEYSNPIPLNFADARRIFNRDVFQNLGELMKLPMDEMIAYPYKDKNGNVVIIDVRYSSGNKKQVVSFYYDGAHVKAKGCPVVLYGIDRLTQYPDFPILIVEGAKTAELSYATFPFITTTARSQDGGGRKRGERLWT